MSHVGKIYNVLSHRMAQQIYQEVMGIREIYVVLLSRIGEPIDHPQIAAAQILPEEGCDIGEISQQVEEIISRELAGITELCAGLARGDYPAR